MSSNALTTPQLAKLMSQQTQHINHLKNQALRKAIAAEKTDDPVSAQRLRDEAVRLEAYAREADRDLRKHRVAYAVRPGDI